MSDSPSLSRGYKSTSTETGELRAPPNPKNPGFSKTGNSWKGKKRNRRDKIKRLGITTASRLDIIMEDKEYGDVDALIKELKALVNIKNGTHDTFFGMYSSHRLLEDYQRQNGSALRNGLCYLVAFPREYWPCLIKDLGYWPTAKSIRESKTVWMIARLGEMKPVSIYEIGDSKYHIDLPVLTNTHCLMTHIFTAGDRAVYGGVPNPFTYSTSVKILTAVIWGPVLMYTVGSVLAVLSVRAVPTDIELLETYGGQVWQCIKAKFDRPDNGWCYQRLLQIDLGPNPPLHLFLQAWRMYPEKRKFGFSKIDTTGGHIHCARGWIPNYLIVRWLDVLPEECRHMRIGYTPDELLDRSFFFSFLLPVTFIVVKSLNHLMCYPKHRWFNYGMILSLVTIVLRYISPLAVFAIILPLLVTNFKQHKIVATTFGTTGDRSAIEYYARRFKDVGIKVHHCNDIKSGHKMLSDIERGSYATAIPATLSAIWDTLSLHYAYDIVLLPFTPSLLSNGVSYTVAPDPKQIKSFNLFEPGGGLFTSMINGVSTWVHGASRGKMTIGTMPGDIPRATHTGIIKPTTNKGSRKTLIALGSSSIKEPVGLDMATTWSTNPASVYQYEDRSDHRTMFPEYQEIYTHGGASTFALAHASGAIVHSLSKLLDRDYKPDCQHYWSADESRFLLQLIQQSPFSSKLWLFGETAHLMSWRVYILVVVNLVLAYLSMSMWAFKTGLSLSPFIAKVAIKSDSVLDLYMSLFSFNTSPIAFIFGFVTYHYIRIMVKTRDFTALQKILRAVSTGLRLYVENSGSPMFQFGSILCGSPKWPVIALVAINANVKLSQICGLKWLYQILSNGRVVDEIINEDKVHLVVQRFTGGESAIGRFFASYLSLNHVEYRNPKLNVSIAVSECQGRCKVIEGKPNNLISDQFYIELDIDVSKWDRIQSAYRENEGRPYGPLNNCISAARNVEQIGFEAQLVTLIMLVISAFYMLTIGVVLLPVILIWGTGAYVVHAFVPHLVFAGGGIAIADRNTILQRLLLWFNSISFNESVVSSDATYPHFECEWKDLTVNFANMRINFAGVSSTFIQPMKGVWRPQYRDHREASYKNFHSLSDSIRSTTLTFKQRVALLELQLRLISMKLTGVVALIAHTRDRLLDSEILDWVTSNGYKYILLTDYDTTLPHIRLNLNGRELASLRYAAPVVAGVRWISLNSQLDPSTKGGLPILADAVNSNISDNMYVGNHAIVPAAAGLSTYLSPIIDGDCFNLSVYGAEEYYGMLRKWTGFIRVHPGMFSTLRSQSRDKVDLDLVFYDGYDSSKRWKSYVDMYSPRAILHAMATCTRLTHLGYVDGVPKVNGIQVTNEIAQAISAKSPIDKLWDDVDLNAKTVCAKVNAIVDTAVKGSGLSENTLKVCNNIMEVLEPDMRAHKNSWAPVIDELRLTKSSLLGHCIHPNPIFVNTTFESTMAVYVNYLNRLSPKNPLSITEFRRRVNTNPNVDLWLADKNPDAHTAGLDASQIACRQVMLDSISRYNKHGFVDALTDDKIDRIVETIYRRDPGMLDDARMADPYILTKKFFKYKKYSAGLPFTYQGSGIRNRNDLRKAGYLKPIAELGLSPLVTGKWYPAIAHAFPKSQVVLRDKIIKNPGKMRSIIATSGFNNVSQQILNYDVNNRHDPLGSNEKVAMPLTGSYFNYIFKDLSRYKYGYSLDCTAMDANLSDGVCKGIAALRKKGFENDPAYSTICKHIDCAMEQTKNAYIINLIDKDISAVTTKDPELASSLMKYSSDQKFDNVSDHAMAPGGVFKKTHGGSTGDSNVTFNNTKGLAIILIYSYCTATGLPYERFFDEVALHNHGDDDVLGTNTPPDVMAKVVDIAKRDLGIEVRFESKSFNLLDQTFLGRTPKDPEQFREEFEEYGIPMPDYAVVNNIETMKLRLHSDKIEATRHKGFRYEIYRLEKCMGYALLCAHHKDFYDYLTEYFNVVKSRLPDYIRNSPGFNKRYKLMPYKTVMLKWYAPIKAEHFQGVHALQIYVGFVKQWESTLVRLFMAAGKICDSMPDHLLTLREEASPYAQSDVYTGIFENHAWHTYVKTNGESPTLHELDERLKVSPFYSFTNSAHWYNTVGYALPTEGWDFTVNYNQSIVMVLIYTTIYINVHRLSFVVEQLPLGAAILAGFNLWMYKSRRLFGALSYMKYVADGTDDPYISSLAPKDPYVYWKRLAFMIASYVRPCRWMGYLPIDSISEYTSKILSVVARVSNVQVLSDGGLQNQPTVTPWRNAVSDALHVVKSNGVPLLVAHTGTGKTRYVPNILLNNSIIPTDMVVVVMPRRLICEQWSKVSGAIYKRKGVSSTGQLMTCTYGYLAHCHIHSIKWWSPNTIFLFDEAHEESIEWLYLRTKFISNQKAVAMTATPAAVSCNKFHIVPVAIQPKYTITSEQINDFDEYVPVLAKRAKRLLIIEPSLRKCKRIAARLIASGHQVKVVHSGDRLIPDDGHIVATSVIEASITIPGCDIVLDAGTRMVNDGGTLRVVPNDIPGSIQRKGRTGRTNNGSYYYKVNPVNRLYDPVPDMVALVSDSPIAEVTPYAKKMREQFMKNMSTNTIPGNHYLHMSSNCPDPVIKRSIGLWHAIMLLTNSLSDTKRAYYEISRGYTSDYDSLTMVVGYDGLHWLTIDEVLNAISEYAPHYIRDGKNVGLDLRISNHNIVSLI